MSPIPKSKDAALIAELNAIAEQAERQVAPMVDVHGRVRIPQKDIIRLHCKDQGGVNDAPGGRHFLFVNEKQLRDYARRKYRVEQNESGEMERFQGDVLVSCSSEQYEKSLQANKALSDKMLRERINKDAKDAKRNPTAPTGEQTQVIDPGTSEWASAHKEAGGDG